MLPLGEEAMAVRPKKARATTRAKVRTKTRTRVSAKTKAKARTVDEDLSRLSVEKRAALERLRKAIHAAAPRAEECISYDLPTFRLGGRMLVSFGAWGD